MVHRCYTYCSKGATDKRSCNIMKNGSLSHNHNCWKHCADPECLKKNIATVLGITGNWKTDKVYDLRIKNDRNECKFAYKCPNCKDTAYVKYAWKHCMMKQEDLDTIRLLGDTTRPCQVCQVHREDKKRKADTLSASELKEMRKKILADFWQYRPL